jgi:O-antigen/teichoic acid export membrane protein
MTNAAPDKTLTSRVAGQGAMLFSGFAASQLMSFARNAILAHALSKGDFGIAAALLMMLQLLDTLTDLGADRLIVQAPDGDDPRFVASQHTALVIRGTIAALFLLVMAAPLAGFFGISEAAGAFAAIAIIPFIKGFQHLDTRRAQRQLNNKPYMLLDLVPQTAALVVTFPILHVTPNFEAAVLIAIAQATAFLLVSHAYAERRYQMAWDRAHFRRLIAFGWPIWLSSFALIAVYQGDRVLIARMFGMEDLASYTAAFMIAMVPGLIAAKVGHSLMLPLFSEAREHAELFRVRFLSLTEATVAVAGAYLAAFVVAGGLVVQVAFGPQYAGLHDLIAVLSLMWAIRMLQAVPGMALMASGDTTPFLYAGLIRAGALVPACAAAIMGEGLVTIAALGTVGEFASLIYVTWRIGQEQPGLARAFLLRAGFLIPSGGMALICAALMHGSQTVPITAAALMFTLGCVAALALGMFPAVRQAARTLAR